MKLERIQKEQKKKEEYKYSRDEKDKSLISWPNGKQFRRDVRLNNQQRKERINDKIAKFFEARKK